MRYPQTSARSGWFASSTCPGRWPGENITITAKNTRPAAHVFLQSVQVGGYEGLSGNYAGPDTVTMVNRWINLVPGQSKT